MQDTTSLASAEASRLCPGDSDSRRRLYESAIATNVRNWREAHAADPMGTKWAALDAMVARIDAAEEPGSAIRAERLDGCRSFAARLLEECGPDYVRQELNRYRLARRFGLPGFVPTPGPRRPARATIGALPAPAWMLPE